MAARQSWMERIGGMLLGASASPDRDMVSDRWWGQAAMLSLAGQAVTAESGAQLAAVQAVLDRLAGTVSTLPFQVFERTGPDLDDRRVAKEHPLYRVLHNRPCARMTSILFRDEQTRHLAWWRNWYARIVPGENPVDELEVIHPSRVLRVFKAADGWIYYDVRRLAPEIGFDTIREDDIWHIRKAPLTENGLQGKPMWETSRETLGRAQAVEQFGALFFANGGSGGGVLKHPGSFKSKDDQDQFLNAWREGGSGLNRHKDRLLLFGVDYAPFSVNNDEAQFLETKREMKYEVASLWGMQGHMVGLLDKATFSNIEQQSIDYVVHTLAPWIGAIEQSAGMDLLIGDDQDRYFVEFNVAGLLRGDLKSRWGAYFQGRQGGWLSINDVRKLENMSPIGPAGDVYETALNMTPAGSQPGQPANDKEDATDA